MLPNILLEELLEALYLYKCQNDSYMESKVWEELKFLVGGDCWLLEKIRRVN